MNRFNKHLVVAISAVSILFGGTTAFAADSKVQPQNSQAQQTKKTSKHKTKSC